METVSTEKKKPTFLDIIEKISENEDDFDKVMNSIMSNVVVPNTIKYSIRLNVSEVYILYKLFGKDPRARTRGIIDLINDAYAKTKGNEKFNTVNTIAAQIKPENAQKNDKEIKALKASIEVQKKSNGVFYSLFLKIRDKFKQNIQNKKFQITFEEYKSMLPTQEEMGYISNAMKKEDDD